MAEIYRKEQIHGKGKIYDISGKLVEYIILQQYRFHLFSFFPTVHVFDFIFLNFTFYIWRG